MDGDRPRVGPEPLRGELLIGAAARRGAAPEPLRGELRAAPLARRGAAHELRCVGGASSAVACERGAAEREQMLMGCCARGLRGARVGRAAPAADGAARRWRASLRAPVSVAVLKADRSADVRCWHAGGGTAGRTGAVSIRAGPVAAAASWRAPLAPAPSALEGLSFTGSEPLCREDVTRRSALRWTRLARTLARLSGWPAARTRSAWPGGARRGFRACGAPAPLGRAALALRG